jgi:hypothetical protein
MPVALMAWTSFSGGGRQVILQQAHSLDRYIPYQSGFGLQGASIAKAVALGHAPDVRKPPHGTGLVEDLPSHPLPERHIPMADPRILSRRKSYSHSETSDAGSSSTGTRDANPDTSVQPAPVVRSEPVVQRTPVVPPTNSFTLPVHGAPVPTLVVPQQASGLMVSKAERPEWEWDAKASTLTLNKVFLFNEEIRTLLTNYPGVTHIVVQPNLVMDKALGLISLLGAATNATSVHFSRPVNSSGGHDDVPYLCADSARALADLAKKNTALTKLAFENLPFETSVFFDGLANGLQDNLTIEVLEISDSGYRSMHSVESPLGNGIAALLTKNRGIKTIIASQNKMYGSGAAAIGAALAMNKSLITLDLGYNLINSDGAKAVFDGLRKNKKTALSKLDLSNCGMDARSAKSLGKLLKQNTSLKEIIVGHVTDPGGSRYIANGLLANKSGCIVGFVSG